MPEIESQQRHQEVAKGHKVELVVESMARPAPAELMGFLGCGPAVG